MAPCQCGFSPSPNGDSPSSDKAASDPLQEATPAPERLRHLYLCLGLSTYQIARITGIDHQRVTRLLRKDGVAVRQRGAGRIRPHRRAAEPAELPLILHELYVGKRLASGEIGRLLGIPERRIRERLREFGIRRQTRGAFNREDRTSVPPGSLETMYLQCGMSADQVGAALGTSRKTILRSAHDLGLPVRAGGAPRGAAVAREIELIEALHADPAVSGTLERHGIRKVPPGGPIWYRFPEPVALSKELLQELYGDCGLSLHHIELLTGQPSATIRRFMTGCGIPLRSAGGRSPFLRRWWRSGPNRP